MDIKELPTPTCGSDVTHPVPGWPAFARKIAKTPAFQAFPSFTDLSVKCLLYYQAKLIYLRKKLHEAEYADDTKNTDDTKESHFARDFEYLIECHEGHRQRDLLEEISTVLNKYHDALIQFSKVTEFPDASSLNVYCLRRCAKKMCRNGSALEGPGSQIYGTTGTAEEDEKSVWQLVLGLLRTNEVKRVLVSDEFEEHLIVPRLGTKTDGLTLWVIHNFIPLFHHVWKAFDEPTWGKLQNRLSFSRHRDKRGDLNTSTIDTAILEGSNFSNIGENNITTYSKKWILCVTSILRTAVAYLTIIVFSRVLGCTALLSLVFGFTRIEIFTATALLMIVVFVQNEISLV